MNKKALVSVLLALSVLLYSCYPELSMQQYDKLKSDIAALDTERKELESTLSASEVELRATEEKNAETLTYVKFLDKLLSVQSSELILSGEFDISALIDTSVELTSMAEKLGDNDIIFYLGLLNAENKNESVAAYYKVIEYSFKRIKQNLE